MKIGTIALAFMALAALFGCGIKDTAPEARLEEARIALDSRDWDRAITILEEFCGTDPDRKNATCDGEKKALLASALAGRGGLDLISVIRNAPPKTGVSGGVDAKAFKAISTAVGDVDDNDRKDFQDSIALLTSIPQRDGDQDLQLTLTVTVDLIGIMAKVSAGFDAFGRPNKIPTLDEVKSILANLQGDLDAIKSLVGQLDPENRLGASVDQISKDIDFDGNNILTDVEVQAYITKLKGS